MLSQRSLTGLSTLADMTRKDGKQGSSCADRDVLEHRSRLAGVKCDTSYLTSPSIEAVRTMVPHSSGDPEQLLELAFKLFTVENNASPNAKQLLTCLIECEFEESNIVDRFMTLSATPSDFYLENKEVDFSQGNVTNHNQIKESELLSYQLKALQLERDFLTNMTKCVLCKERPREVTFLPCGHFSLCSTCSDKTSRCPVDHCQQEALAEIRTFVG